MAPKTVAEAADNTQPPPDRHLFGLLEQTAERFPDRDAVVALRQTEKPGPVGAEVQTPLRWTFSELHTRSVRLAASLAQAGIGKGSRIAAFLLNEAEWAVLFWAAARLGSQFAPLDPRMLGQRADALHLLRKLEPAAVFVSAVAMTTPLDAALTEGGFQPVVKSITRVSDDESFPDGWTTLPRLMELQRENAPTALVLPPSPTNTEDTVLILFTSGTTSLPKGCPHTTRSIATPGLMVVNTLNIKPGDHLCGHLPSFHIFAIVMTLGTWFSGATVVYPSPTFDPAASLEAIRLGAKVHTACVPSMVQAIASQLTSDSEALQSLYQIVLGGASLSPSIVELCLSLGADRVIAGYGTTEGVATLLHFYDAASYQKIRGEVCLGPPRAGARVRICAPDSKIPIRRGQLGELHQGGDPIFGGYLDASAEDNRTCYQEDGVNWSATGDQGYMDEEGNVYLLGRYKDLIIRGGENISPVKIEQCLTKIPGVREAYVVGIPDPVAGEVPMAVIRRDRTVDDVSTRMLQAKVQEELGRSFAPTMILDLQEDLQQDRYPTTTTGKVLKPTLQTWVVEYLQQQAAPESASGDDLVSQIAAIWVAITGLHADQLDLDAPIRTFADSMMMIQYLHTVTQRLGRVTRKDLIEHDTIRKQADFLLANRSIASRKASVMQPPSPGSPPTSLDPARVQQVGEATLRPLGFSWDDVEETLPVTDTQTWFLKDTLSPSAFKIRTSWIAAPGLSVEYLEAIIHLWIHRHPLLRSTVAQYDQDRMVWLIMRPTARWMQQHITHGRAVDHIAALTQYHADNPWEGCVVLPGPFLKATLVRDRDSSRAGVILHCHHGIYDAVTIFRWLQDFKDLLANNGLPRLDFRSYGRFLADYQQYISSAATADAAVAFHVQRLQGVSARHATPWPRLSTWNEVRAQGLDPFISTSTKRSVRLPQLAEMRRASHIPVPVIGKAACVLLNAHRTGVSEAVFNVAASGRVWPDETRAHPNPLEIDGPMIGFCVERVLVQPAETVRELLTRLTADQDVQSLYTHAPFSRVLDRLRALDAAAGTNDAGFIEQAAFAQVFNWRLEQYAETEGDPIRMVDFRGGYDLGVIWLPTLLEGDVLELELIVNTLAVGGEAEIVGLMEEFLAVMGWLCEVENLDKRIAECRYEGAACW
ncbi:AMP-binding enzyme family protein [Aspergillus saccharolyticus JOP 1030-1]|uniref:AMP-binding enzyme family protein n=1 Tax=Aspergillus saccharolyticus JOP 1030-1 TaxID=1450539 RepID=A0A318Z593_9EURO|nr:AMP-binding enzyme family protein [Aspergillus saccharolyticus JOP 1030-1]PYH42276.1 AMP-binding enzyme family protein [Aspergillus saccharolyticus JOP 1030-1]